MTSPAPISYHLSTAPEHHCFHFEEKHKQAHIILHPLVDSPKTDFTLDFHFEFSKMTSDPHFFSYATRRQSNELVFSMREIDRKGRDDGIWQLVPINDVRANVKYRLSISVKDTTMLIYWNGALYKKKAVRRLSLQSGGLWILGQDQDAMGGNFNLGQRVIGKICNFRMWNIGMEETNVFVAPNATKSQVVFDSPPSYKFEKANGAY